MFALWSIGESTKRIKNTSCKMQEKVTSRVEANGSEQQQNSAWRHQAQTYKAMETVKHLCLISF